jgi:hypothetical protein
LLNVGITGLTTLAKIVELITLLVDGLLTVTGIKMILAAQTTTYQKINEGIQRIVNWLLGSRNSQSATITNAIYDFFGGSDSFAASGSMNSNVRRNTPRGQVPSLTGNILSFP